MSAHDPYIQFTHLFSEDGRHQSSPLFLLPENVKEWVNGKIWVGNGSYVVRETAMEIHAKVTEKIAENKQADTLGKV